MIWNVDRKKLNIKNIFSVFLILSVNTNFALPKLLKYLSITNCLWCEKKSKTLFIYFKKKDKKYQ